MALKGNSRKLYNAKLTKCQCSLIGALSGEVLVKFRKIIPYHFDLDDFGKDLHLEDYIAIHESGEKEALEEVTFTNDRKDIRVLRLPFGLPQNVWYTDRHLAGWRRWYKDHAALKHVRFADVRIKGIRKMLIMFDHDNLEHC